MRLGDTREDIYYLIQENPGIHFREISQKLNREIGVIDYHIQQLENSQLIISVKYRSLKIFFDHSWKNSINEIKLIVGNLKKTTSRSILLLLSEDRDNENISLKLLAEKLGKSPSNLHWHVKRLIEDRMVRSIRLGRNVTLKLNIEKKIIHKLGNLIFPSKWEIFLDDIHNRLI